MHPGLILFAFGVSCWISEFGMKAIIEKFPSRMPDWAGLVCAWLLFLPGLILLVGFSIDAEEGAAWKDRLGNLGAVLFMWHYHNGINRPVKSSPPLPDQPPNRTQGQPCQEQE